MSDNNIIDLVVCMEELAELQQAISKFIRGKANMNNLHEEIADVEICLDKIYRICGIDQTIIFEWKTFKINRLERGDKYESSK